MKYVGMAPPFGIPGILCELKLSLISTDFKFVLSASGTELAAFIGVVYVVRFSIALSSPSLSASESLLLLLETSLSSFSSMKLVSLGRWFL